MSRHVVDAITTGRTSRTDLVKRGRKLEYFTIAYNSLEGLIAIVAGLFAGSIALIGFGFDSVIEVTSGGMLFSCGAMTPRTQKITLSLSGGCGFGGSRVRIDVCRKRLYVYDRCRAPTMPRRPSASIAHGSCFGKSSNFPMLSSNWRKTARFRRVKPTATWNTLSN